MPLRLPPSIPIRPRTTTLLVLASTLACAVQSTGVPDDVPAWLRADPQRCLLPRDLGENRDAMARRCAELFVAENGYTDGPATDDSTRWVMEDGEQGPWLRVFAGRVGMLDKTATAVQAARGNVWSSFAPAGCPRPASTALSRCPRSIPGSSSSPLRCTSCAAPSAWPEVWDRRKPPTSNYGPRRRGPGTAVVLHLLGCPMCAKGCVGRGRKRPARMGPCAKRDFARNMPLSIPSWSRASGSRRRGSPRWSWPATSCSS